MAARRYPRERVIGQSAPGGLGLPLPELVLHHVDAPGIAGQFGDHGACGGRRADGGGGGPRSARLEAEEAERRDRIGQDDALRREADAGASTADHDDDLDLWDDEPRLTEGERRQKDLSQTDRS